MTNLLNLNVTWVLTRRETTAKLKSVWLYILMSGICLLSILFGNGFLRSFETETVLISSGPLAAFNAAVLVVVGLVSGIRLAGSLSWEREHRTLEVLLVGPASHASVIISKFLAELLVLILLLAVYALFLVLGQPLGRGVLTLSDVGDLAVWSAYLLPAMAMGLLVASLFSTVRGAVVGFLLVFGALFVIEVIRIWLAPLSPRDMPLALLFTRSALDVAAPVFEPASAVSHLFSPVLIYLGRGVTSLSDAFASLTLSAVMLILAILVSRRRAL